MRRAPLPKLFGRDVRRIHCVGIGGMGVGPLAIYLAQLGFDVTGEDDALGEPMAVTLKREGVAVRTLPADCELVMYSSAIARNHPVYIAAANRSLPLVRRGELLAEVVREQKLVAICGAHGKTTTTGMAITALRRAEFPAGYIMGGLFNHDVPPARAGSNEWVVAEIDESDGTIEHFSPEITVAVNLDWDHPDYYRQPADLEATFASLMRRTRSTVLTSDACPLSQRLVAEHAAKKSRDSTLAKSPATSPRFSSFGRTGDFSAQLESEAGERMELRLGGQFSIKAATVRARGQFNVANATAALAAVQLMGVSLAPPMLADYPGVRRRQAVLATSGRITVIEDYAHHPAEIRALLSSLRQRIQGEGRLRVVFQPHRFTRTAQFRTEFAAALGLADAVYLLDVYAAGESPIAGGTSADIYAEVKRHLPTLSMNYLPGGDDSSLQLLAKTARAGDLVAFVGAGDIEQKAYSWVSELQLQVDQTKRWDDLAGHLRAELSAATKLKREEPLAPKTTMRVGGAARLYAEPASLDDLRILWREAHVRGIELFLLGRGSNLIVPDHGVDGLVISLAHSTWAKFEPRPDGRILVGAGLRLKNLCGLAGKAGLTGFEFLEGIPGSVGGALRMNAGAMGGWMFDVVEEVQLITAAGEIKTLKKDEMHVEYRHCAELHDAIALGAVLRPASQMDAEGITRQIDVYRRKRHESQPREPSAGCIFKNPPGGSAGRLIDESGLKGERVGDAEVSPVHANFIVNRGNATSGDVLELVRRVRARVRQVKGVDLEPEVLLYGQAWKNVL